VAGTTVALHGVGSVRGRRVNGCRRPFRSGTVRAVESTDSVLAARLAAGDDRALAEILDVHGAAVYRTAQYVLGDPMTAQDVVQDVFVELWRHPQRYDAALGSLRTYLTLCARHRAHDVVRSELRRTGRETRHVRLLEEAPDPGPGDRLARAETATAVRDAVRLLPPDQREVVELAYFGGLSYRAVAEAVGIPEGTAKSRVRLALAKLGNLLDRQLLEPS
jgi:RNA polymerase sigma-70 factor, ECF subfamily